MSLPGEVRTLRDRVLSDLISTHDYYSDTKTAWLLVRELLAGGQTIKIENLTTGTITTREDLVAKAPGYITEQLAEATFQQFIAIFENFYFELLRLWLTAYPQSLGKRTVEFRTVLDLPDKEAITDLIVRRELNEVLYDRPAEWFAYLEDRAKLGCPTPDEIVRIAEAKATRDVLVHNRGIANKTYELKASNVARFRDGYRIEISEAYHQEKWELIRKVVSDVSNAVIAKVTDC